MKYGVLIFMVLVALPARICLSMQPDEPQRFITSKTQRLVTVKEYNPGVDGALLTLKEWDYWKDHTDLLHKTTTNESSTQSNAAKKDDQPSAETEN